MDISAMTDATNSLDDQRDATAEGLPQEKGTPYPAASNGIPQGLDNENKFQSAISAWRSEFLRKESGIFEA